MGRGKVVRETKKAKMSCRKIGTREELRVRSDRQIGVLHSSKMNDSTSFCTDISLLMMFPPLKVSLPPNPTATKSNLVILPVWQVMNYFCTQKVFYYPFTPKPEVISPPQPSHGIYSTFPFGLFYLCMCIKPLVISSNAVLVIEVLGILVDCKLFEG